MHETERIDDARDPRVADYRELKESALARGPGVFIAEGTEVLRTLVLRSPYAVRSILLAPKHLEPLADVLERVPRETPIYVAPLEVMSAIAGFDIHRGCLAAGERPAPRDPEAVLEPGTAFDVGRRGFDAREHPAPRTAFDVGRKGFDVREHPAPRDAAAKPERERELELVLVLEAITNHDNIGALFRNAAAFGARAILLDPRCADPLYRKSIRVSMGTALTVPFAHLSPWPGSLEILERRGWALWSLTPREHARDLGELLAMPAAALPEKIALLLGTEGPGLSEAALDRAKTHLKIPMAEGVDSLNVATAAAIALFALRVAERGSRTP